MIATLAAGLAHAERRTDAPTSPAPAQEAPVEERLRKLQEEFRSYCLPINDPLPAPQRPSRVVRIPLERES